MIQGREYAFEDITLVVFGRPVLGLRAISYKVSRKKDNILGRGAKPVARGRGPKVFEGSVTVLFSELRALLDSVPQPANGSSRDITDLPAFNIIVSYQVEGGGRVVTDKLFDCEFNEFEIAWESEDQFAEIELPLIIGDIKYNQ